MYMSPHRFQSFLWGVKINKEDLLFLYCKELLLLYCNLHTTIGCAQVFCNIWQWVNCNCQCSMQVQRHVNNQCYQNFVPVPLLMWPTQRQLKTLLSDTGGNVVREKRQETLSKGTSMVGFLLPSLVLLLTATGLRWVVEIYFTWTKAFRGSAPEPGIWNFGNLTGESNYVGVVKNAFKGSRLDIRWVDNV